MRDPHQSAGRLAPAVEAEVESLTRMMDAVVEDALAMVRDDDALEAAMAAEPDERLEALREPAD